MAHISVLHASTFTSLDYVVSTATMENVADALGIFGEAIQLTVSSDTIVDAAGTSTGVLPIGTRIVVGSDIAVLTSAVTLTGAVAVDIAAGYTGTLTDGTSKYLVINNTGVTAIGNVREFPSLGTPANIVNVPVYGQSISAQVSGQADAPSLEFTLNYVPADHYALDTLRVAGSQIAFRVRLASAENGLAGGEADEYDDFYFKGTIASLEITPALNDATQATLALTINTDFFGPAAATATGYALPA